MTTKIEWVRNKDGTQGYTINPVKGLCPVGCDYCYARRMYKRFKWNPEIRYAGMLNIPSIKKPSRIFVGSTMELFGEWIREEWLEDIFEKVWLFPEHTFIFLTKQPQNLIKWSPFPENCFVGVTATDADMCIRAGYCLTKIEAKVKFLSLEPLLDWQHGKPGFIATMLQTWGINWLIIGQQTPISAKTQPRIEWVREIVEAADRARIPVFLKDNLGPLLRAQGAQDNRFWRDLSDQAGFEPLHFQLRQELPAKEE